MSSNFGNKDGTQNDSENSNRSYNRRNSIFHNFLSLASPTSPPPPRHNSLSSSTTSSTTSPYPPSPPSSTTNHDNHHNIISGSPDSSLLSSAGLKSPNSLYSIPNDPYPPSPHSRRQSSVSSSLGGLTSSFRWPGSTASSTTSTVQPIPIPTPSAFPILPDDPAPPAPIGHSAPNKRTSVGGPSFRRAFELPTYTNIYNLDECHQGPPAEPAPSTTTPPAPTTRRGRSGSLFGSFGVTELNRRATTGPVEGGDRRVPPRRKLSPMGERMIRDHPF